jgi:N-hydroxyarylamine O-acetyltransferase
MVDDYLHRIGVDGPVTPTPDSLARLMGAHLATVPFENLDIHLGVPIVLDVERLVAKIVGRRRGGFCYELNGAFSWLLEQLGFSVRGLEARVLTPDGPGIHFDHLCLEVQLDHPWLVDVGFGAAFAAPLRLDLPDVVQHDPAGDFRIIDAGDGWYDLVQNDAPQYRFSRQPHALADFADGCVYHQTSPESHFTQGTICTLPVDGGRTTLSGSMLIRTSATGERSETRIDPYQLGPVLAEHFGVVLSSADLVRLSTDNRSVI